MCNSKLRKLTCVVLAVTLIVTTGSLAAFAETESESAGTTTEQTQAEEPAEEVTDAEGEQPVSEEPELTLSATPVSSSAKNNYAGNFKVKFVGGWNDATQEEAYSGWTLKYYLKDQDGKTLASDVNVSGFTYKVTSSSIQYRLVCVATNTDGTKQTLQSNLLDAYKFPGTTTVTVSCPKSDNRVTVKWKKVSGAAGYLIYCTTSKSKTPSTPIKTITSGSTTKYKDKARAGKKKYYYYVRAYYKKTANESTYKTASKMSKKTSKSAVTVNRYITKKVRRIRWYTHIKKTAKLYKNKTGSATKGSIKKGTYVRVTGQYPKKVTGWDVPSRVYVKVYANKKSGKVLKEGWVKWGNCKKIKGDTPYSKKLKTNADYTKAVKEDWINGKKYSSSTKYLIWTSSYSQHVTIFKGSKGKWKVYKSFRCNTGKFQQPTPKSTKFTIKKHLMKRVRLTKYGNPYYYTHLSFFTGGNSFHTICWYEGTTRVCKGMSTGGQPNTRGCVRLDKSNAVWIYNNIPNGTRVISY